MSLSNNHNDLYGKKFYLLLVFIVSIPVFFASMVFAESAGINEEETIAFATCIIFYFAIFAGRYVGMIRGTRAKPIRNSRFIILGLVITAGVSWLFFYAQFPLSDRHSLSLLFFWLPFGIVSFTTGLLVKLTRATAERQIAQAQAIAAHSQSEVNLLQSQLSPHFLFNTLNNLYGLSISHHEKIPPLLLRLSDLLRYSVYEATEPFVPLRNEMAYINNFIEFEKLRIGDKLVLSNNIILPEKEVRVAPMLLIVFIENAFKHSKNTTDEKVFIEIELKTWENYILFTLRNSRAINKSDTNNAVSGNSGYGMKNVMKRLELLYPNEHNLNIEESDKHYKVALQLKMK